MMAGAGKPDPFGLAPFSRSERERRYGAVRAVMRQQGLDALILTCSGSLFGYFHADVTYLTQIGGNGAEVFAVFPLDGEPMAVIPETQRIEFWREMQDWVEDIRGSEHQHWSRPLVARLRELGLERGSIGLVGLGGMRAPEGIIPWRTFEALREAFPQARFTDASALVESVRRVKSAEEIRVCERAAEALEAGIQAMVETAREGATDHQVWTEVLHAMMRAGGEPGALYYWRAGPAPNRTAPVPTHRPLQRGDVIMNEFDARCLGYNVQGIHPLSVGTPPDDYLAMSEVSERAFEAVRKMLRPGVPLGRIWDTVAETAAGTPFEAVHPSFHGNGLGEDGPIDLVTLDAATWRDVPAEAGMVLMVQPSIGCADATGRRRRISVGESVVVEEGGARRLTRRPLRLAVV